MYMVDLLPLWAVYLLTVLLALVAIELGFRLGRSQVGEESEGAVSAMTAAALGLLAFLLAIITGVAVNRFDNRRQLALQEANAIGTAYLRAGYLDEPYRTESRSLYREYVDLRLAALDQTQLATAVARSEAIHTELWSQAEAVARTTPESDVAAIYIEALNTVIDLHSERVIAVTTTRMAPALWVTIYVMALLTMVLVGLYNSIHGRRNFVAVLVLVLIFAAVLLMIVDLDRPQEGLFQVNPQAMLDLQRQINAPTP